MPAAKAGLDLFVMSRPGPWALASGPLPNLLCSPTLPSTSVESHVARASSAPCFSLGQLLSHFVSCHGGFVGPSAGNQHAFCARRDGTRRSTCARQVAPGPSWTLARRLLRMGRLMPLGYDGLDRPINYTVQLQCRRILSTSHRHGSPGQLSTRLTSDTPSYRPTRLCIRTPSRSG